MLTKGKNIRVAKYLVVVVALIAVLAMCLTACSGPAVKDVKYNDGSLTKTVYNEGETFDCTGAKITVTYEDGSTKVVDVTATMTGTVVLKGVGEKDVAVSYTEDGESFTAYIPVTVVNPTKDAAIAALKTDAVASANANDKGVQKLIDAYTALITDAATADVAALSTEYTAAVKAYVDAKAACLATLNDATLLEDLYKQNIEKAVSIKADALVLYNSATEAAAFAEIASAYELAIEKLIADQEFYEGNESGNGQIVDKIDLLYKIEDYVNGVDTDEKKVEGVIDRMNAVLAVQGNQDDYDYYYAKYTNVLKKFDYFYKYVNLAIDLEKTAKMVDEYYIGVMRTQVDEIYDMLCDVETKVEITYSDAAKTLIESVKITTKNDIMADGEGITVIPAPYVSENGTVALGTDTLDALLDKIDAAKAKGVEEFGATNIDDWMDSYKPFGASATASAINLTDYVTEFKNVYTKLANAQADAEAVIEAIADINLSDNTKTVAEKQQMILNAWTALINWNTTHSVLSAATAPVFATDSTDGSAYAIGYEKTFAGIYSLGLNGDGEVAKAWSNYNLDKDFVVKYFIHNLDVLLDASVVGERIAVEELIADIKDPIIYSTDLTVDAKASIEAARAAYNKYETKYADRVDNELFFPVDANGNIVMDAEIAAAEAEYQAIVDAANALIAKIDALKAAADITIGDYETTVDGMVRDGALKIAYNDFIAFTNEINHGYNDVITNKAKLLDCVKAYIVLAWADAKHVEGKVTISGEYVRCVGLTNPETDTAIRTQLSDIEEAKRAELAAETYDNSGVGELLLISDFEDALDELHETAETLAKAITDAYEAWAN